MGSPTTRTNGSAASQPATSTRRPTGWAAPCRPPARRRTLQSGTIQIGPSNFVPDALTLDVGTLVAEGVGAPSVSNIDVNETSLPSVLTIDNTTPSAPGDAITGPSYNGPAIESALNAIGYATSDATFNVGAGDVEQFNVTAASGPSFFDNEGVINLHGAAGNDAVALVGFGETGASAFYGDINLSHGFLYANLPDTPSPG